MLPFSLRSAGIFLMLLPLMTSLRAQSVFERQKQLNDFLKEEWEFEMRTQPEVATIVGDYRYNDKLSDLSPAGIEANVEQTRRFLDRLEKIDMTGLPDFDQLNKRLLARNLRLSLRSFDLKLHEMPIDQMFGFHLQVTQMVPQTPFRKVRDYEDYLARLRQLPRAFDQVIELAKAGERDGLMPPRRLLEKVVTQSNAIAGSALGAESPFLKPVQQFPEEVPAADRARLRAAIEAAVKTGVVPAYERYARFVSTEYAPKGRIENGVSSLPNGQAIYGFLIAQSTTTSMTAEEIHQLGLREVASIENSMQALARQQGYADLKSFQEALKNNPKNKPASAEAILERYRKYTDEMYGKVGNLFGRLPKARLTVVPVESFREKEAPDAEYQQGSPDGTRKGRVVVNTGEYQKRTYTQVEATAYHEGIPGHHFQISIAQELPALPAFRQHAFYTAYVEGWGLYAERLGKEVGLYQDPVSEYGRLASEMLRAIRLVVDTGVHAKGWSREQMVDYFHQHSTEDEPSVQAEVDRYIAIPGQALAYKVGQLKIIELRERAKSQLGQKFDIKAFHDEVLGGGALPIDVLEARINSWIAAQKEKQTERPSH
jgi:uncharacterized protein (DUF885 family)